MTLPPLPIAVQYTKHGAELFNVSQLREYAEQAVLAERQRCAALDESDRDWSLLEATQESLREHMAEIKQLRDECERLKNHAVILAETARQVERERCAALFDVTVGATPIQDIAFLNVAARIRTSAE